MSREVHVRFCEGLRGKFPGSTLLVLIHKDKSYLQECLKQMRAMAETLKLEFNEKTKIFPVSNGVDYLGWHFYLTETGKVVKRLRTQNKKRLKRRMKGLQKGYADGRLYIPDLNRSIASTHGHLKYGHTYHLRKKIYQETVFRRSDTNRMEEER